MKTVGGEVGGGELSDSSRSDRAERGEEENRRAGGTKGRTCCPAWANQKKNGRHVLDLEPALRSEGKSATSRLMGESVLVTPAKNNGSRATW